MTSRTVAPNPYDYVNEVSNPDLFAGRREELAQIEEEVSRLAATQAIAPMVAVTGERRIGKTSISLRAQEICEKYRILTVRVSLTDMTAASSWEFWQEIFYGLLTVARRQSGTNSPSLGFLRETAEENIRFGLTEAQLEFFSAYGSRTSTVPPNYLINEGLRSLIDAIVGTGQKGVLLIIDEAHLLVESNLITQQLRFAIRNAGRCGVIFVGETELAQLFSDRTQPLFAQGQVIPLNNFAAQADVAECALLPLMEDERQLVSPMTIDYLVRLSQGKPNQIRLICHSIYNRYRKEQQADLNITIEALDDVLDSIAAIYTDYDVRHKVETIRTLNSVDLESLYNMTRYPNWAITDIVGLDESFRSEGKSLAASSRREAMLREKRDKFVGLGLMEEDPHKYTLAGDEFLSLYLRFWYEVSKQGNLSRSLVLGKGPATSFGEKTEKLVRFVTWQLRRRPAIVMRTFSHHDLGIEDRVEAVKAWFGSLQDLLGGTPVNLEQKLSVLYEWFSTCELVRRPGLHHLLCLTVRNLENPRETMGIELYFDSAEIPLIIEASTLKALRQHAEDARILVDGWDNLTVNLPSLNGLLEAIGGPRLEEYLEQVGTLERWRIASVQHHVGSADEDQEAKTSEPDTDNEEEANDWIKLYEDDKLSDAEGRISQLLSTENKRHRSARLYNDRGYIRYGLQKNEEAKRDLQRALDLHCYHLPLTLSNLAVVELDEGNIEEAISYIREAIFLTLSAEDVSAGYLRLRFPTGPRATRGHWEQHPANVLEASYVNLSFALLQSGSSQEASEVLEEGLALMPSSVRLRHAFARLHLSLQRVDLAEPFYREIAGQPISDSALSREINLVLRSAPRERSRRR